jgi:NTE family protein
MSHRSLGGVLGACLILGAWLGPARAQGSSPQGEAPRAAEDDGVVFLITFSGGGTRAAAFGYGVVQTLRGQRVGGVSLLERIDAVAGVSGGSFMAAQVSLDRSSRGLARFREEMLLTDIETGLVKSAAKHGIDLLRGDYNRSDAAAAYYGQLFEGATLADAEAAAGPELWVQVSDLLGGAPLALRPEDLAHMGLTPAQVKVGQALAASAAVPGALPPLNLALPGHTPARCPGAGCGEARADPPVSTPFADGGIVDNLGLEVLFRAAPPAGTRAVVVVVVNARRMLSAPWKLEDSGAVSAGYTVALQQRVLDRTLLARARERLRVLELESRVAGRSLATELVLIDFQASPRAEALSQIGTRFDLDPAEVRLLIEEGQSLAKTATPRLLRHWRVGGARKPR